MSLQARKLVFIQEVINLSDIQILSKLENFLKMEKEKVHKKEIKPMSLSDFYDMIDKSMQDAEMGKVTSNSDLKEKIKKWH